MSTKTNTPSGTPPTTRAFDLLAGMFTAQVIAAMVTAQVFDTIGHGSKTPDEVATACGLDRNTLARALRFLEVVGVVNKDKDAYALTDVGKCFLKDVPGSLHGSVSFISAPPWRDSWNNFSHCLRTGEPAFDHVFKQPFFTYLDRNQEYGKPFNQYMTMMTTMVAPLVADAYDFGQFKTVCDVGGGQGILLKAVLEKHGGCKGILFDMENALKEHVLGGLVDRTELVTGSFFEKVPRADCLLLKTVIHDWNDANSIRILTNCGEALHKGGKVLLVEQVIERPFTMMGLFYDLHMQVMLGGAERTEEEFAQLLAAAGLKLNRIIPTPSPMKLIEAVAAG